MANDCLVKKLKGVVDNDNLPYYGHSIFVLKGNDNVGGFQIKVASGTIKLIGGTYSSGGSTPVKEIVADPNTKYAFAHTNSNTTVTPDIPGGDVKIIFPKYTVYILENYSDEFSPISIDELEYSAGLTKWLGGYFTKEWDIANVSKWPNLEYINIQHSNTVGDVSVLSTLLSLTYINLAAITKLTGNLDACGALALTYLGVPNTKGISLNIENFVTYARNAGRTTGSLTNLPYVGACNCTFNGESVPNQASNSLSWTATTITFNGVTIDA